MKYFIVIAIVVLVSFLVIGANTINAANETRNITDVNGLAPYHMSQF